MKYADSIERTIDNAKGSGNSLTKLLRSIDTINKSVPTLDDLNEAFIEVKHRGKYPVHDWSPVTKDTYGRAVEENKEWIAKFLEKQGISREQQKQALEWHKQLWKNNEN